MRAKPKQTSGCGCGGRSAHTGASAAALLPLGHIRTVDDGRRRLGELLGLPDPVSADVFVSAIEDPVYLDNLYISRGAPEFLGHLLAAPPRRHAVTDSPLALVKRASKALARWSNTGFTQVTTATYERRLDACRNCPHLVEPPPTMLHRIGGSGIELKKICGLCGCFVDRKAKLASELCPSRSPELAGMSRWNDPYEEAR